MTPQEIDAFEKYTIEICTNHEAENWDKDNYRASVLVPPRYIVKYGDPEILWPETATQRYIFEYAKSQQDTPFKPRISNVVHY